LAPICLETSESPSWVSWGEVEIWGTPHGEIPPRTTSTTVLEMLPEGGPGLILHGGTVITVDSDFTVSEAIAVSGGVIEAVGSSDEVLALRGADTTVVDLGGATVIPGIVDPHIHMIQHQTPDHDEMASAQKVLIESGRTTVGIPGIIPINMEGFEGFEDRALLRIHLYLSYNTNCGEPPPDPDYWRSFDFSHDPADRIAVAGVKVFADGGSCHGPAVGWDYPDPLPEGIGFTDWVGQGSLFITAEELAAVIRETGDKGGQVVVHVAGERAVVTGLDGMELALGDEGNPQRHRLDHNDFVPPEHRSRYGELSVAPLVFGDYDSCFEPAGMWSVLAPEEVLSWHRANRELVEANPGLPIAWHSDVPFTSFDVFAQLQFLVNVAEVTDEGVYCDPPDFLADEGVGVVQAIRMMTWNAAYAMALESSIGSLEPGKRADLIIIESNPLDLPEDEAYRNVVWVTMIDGVAEHCVAPAEMCDQLSS
jgi:predicted amidohydrolase YtcJ